MKNPCKDCEYAIVFKAEKGEKYLCTENKMVCKEYDDYFNEEKDKRK